MERVVVETDPLNAATPMSMLDGRLIPAEQFYVRSHFPPPEDLGPDQQLTISGMVGSPTRLTLQDLQQLPTITQAVTLECAGNGRTALSPPAPGTPWGFGAAGAATFTGAALRDVLDLADALPDAEHVLAIGADSGEVEGHTLPYSRSLPMARALHRDTMLAWEMNGQPLTAEHGAPLRLVVPGWYAMASVKWVVELCVRSSEFHGWFHEERYCYLGDEIAEEGAPVSSIRVRSVIAAPSPGATLQSGQPTDIVGAAWAGREGVRAVEVSTDGGATFHPAALADAEGPYAPRPWRLAWQPTSPGEHELLVRATDNSGRSQPLEQRWNRLGYGNNVTHRITVNVV